MQGRLAVADADGEVSAALARRAAPVFPYISVLTHPTTGGVGQPGHARRHQYRRAEGADWFRLVSRHLSRPRETLPEGFQRSEFLPTTARSTDRRSPRDARRGSGIARVADAFVQSGVTAPWFAAWTRVARSGIAIRAVARHYARRACCVFQLDNDARKKPSTTADYQRRVHPPGIELDYWRACAGLATACRRCFGLHGARHWTSAHGSSRAG